MANRVVRMLIVGAAAAALYVVPAIAQMQEVQGIVVSNRNGSLVIKTPSGDQAIVSGLSGSPVMRALSPFAIHRTKSCGAPPSAAT